MDEDASEVFLGVLLVGLKGVSAKAMAMHASQGSSMFQVLFPTYRGHASGEEYWEKPPLASA